jgi:hypothetical protein
VRGQTLGVIVGLTEAGLLRPGPLDVQVGEHLPDEPMPPCTCTQQCPSARIFAVETASASLTVSAATHSAALARPIPPRNRPAHA